MSPNMVNFSPLTVLIDLLESLGRPSKFQWVSRLAFVTAVTSLTGGQPNFARCLAVSSARTLCIHFQGLLPHERILPRAKFTLCPSLAFSYIASVTARHSSSGRQPNFTAWYKVELLNFRRGHHLYSAGRPSRWASAHILLNVTLQYWYTSVSHNNTDTKAFHLTVRH